MSAPVKDMTRGNPAKLIVLFALPLMVGNVFQQLYTMTDAIIVGQFAGVQALGAVGSTDWLSWLVFGLISGVMQGFSIPVAQRFGAGDLRGLRRCVSTLLVLAAVLAVGFTVLGLIFAGPLLRLIGTQQVVFRQAKTYLSILYGGIFITAAYNLFAALLRALGNSRAPLLAMLVASGVNIALDLLFVMVFRWDVAGAAAATVIAQGSAAVICLISVLRLEQLRFQKGEFLFHKGDAGLLMKLAAPLGLQNILISVGGVVVQSVINSLGFEFVAGITASGKLSGLQETAAMSFGLAVTTYTGQNLGAGQIQRIHKGVRSTAFIALGTSAVLSCIMFAFGRAGLSLFIEKSADAMVTEVATNYLHAMSATLFLLYFLHVYRSALYGLGETMMPMLSSIVQCVMRILVAWGLTRIVSPWAICFTEPAAWLGALTMLLFVYRHKMEKLSL